MKSLIIKTCLLFSAIMLFSNCSAVESSTIIIVTDMGEIEIQLYDNTPLHRDNFIKLVKEGFYDGVLFHRVIKSFMIQAGDPNSKNAKPEENLGSGGPNYTIPAEFVPENIHKRGALAAARMPDNINPEKASSGSQFYIVQGKIFTDEELNMVEMQIGQQLANQKYVQFRKEEEDAMLNAGQTVNNDSIQARAERRASAWWSENPYKMKEEYRQIYKEIGGAPHLDGEYTVFGEVIKGIEIIDQIAEIETDNANRPKTDIRIKKMKFK